MSNTPELSKNTESEASKSSSPLPTSSNEAKSAGKTANQVLDELSKDMIKSTGEYIKGEIDLCISDYKVLEQMNKLVTERYKNLDKNAISITSEMNKLNAAYENIMPLLAQIDDVEKCVTELEQTANKLEVYSKRLENKYKQFAEKHQNK